MSHYWLSNLQSYIGGHEIYAMIPAIKDMGVLDLLQISVVLIPIRISVLQ